MKRASCNTGADGSTRGSTPGSTSGSTPRRTHHHVPRAARMLRLAGRALACVALGFGLAAGLGGCGLAAAPCRIASAGLKIVPVVGHAAAAPTDACADVIDP